MRLCPRSKLSNWLCGFLIGMIVLTVIGCAHADRIIINGETALAMSNHINTQLWDDQYLQRGNTVSNMRNGGYVLSDDNTIWFINEMVFTDASSVHYVQRLPIGQIGSLTARNDIIAELDGTLIGIFERFLLFKDSDSHTVEALSLIDFTFHPVYEKAVSVALLLGDVLYVSNEQENKLYRIKLGVDLTNQLGGSPTLLYEDAGMLLGVVGDTAYVLEPESLSTIQKVDVTTGQLLSSLVGGPYVDVQLSGSWLFYRDGTHLMRQRVTGEAPVSASIREVAEYVVWGHYLAFTSPNGGIFVSHLDGSRIAQISNDTASGLQLRDNMLFYRNAFDSDALYVIDLQEGLRSALLEPSLTDGGLQFSLVEAERQQQFSQAFGSFILQESDTVVSGERYTGSLQEPVLFVEVDSTEDTLRFYQLKDQKFAAQDVGALVIIGSQHTVLGRYTDGGIAYRSDTTLTLFQPKNRNPYLTWVVQGRPPSEIKSGEGDRYGLPISWHQRALDLIDLIRSHQ